MVDQSDDPSARAVRRIEVIADSIGRRRWPDDLKARIVAESFAPGAVVAEVARRHNARAQQVHGWRRDAREGRLALRGDDPAFVPLLASLAETGATALSAPAVAVKSAAIEIVFCGATLRAPADAAVLTALITALRRSAC